MNQTQSGATGRTLKKLHGPDLREVRKEVAARQQAALAKGIPIYYAEDGVLIEELGDGTKRAAVGPEKLACETKLGARKTAPK